MLLLFLTLGHLSSYVKEELKKPLHFSVTELYDTLEVTECAKKQSDALYFFL